MHRGENRQSQLLARDPYPSASSIISQLTSVVGNTPVPILSAVVSPQTNRKNQNSSNLYMPASSHLPRPVHPIFTNSTSKDILVYRITDENKLKFVPTLDGAGREDYYNPHIYKSILVLDQIRSGIHTQNTQKHTNHTTQRRSALVHLGFNHTLVGE